MDFLTDDLVIYYIESFTRDYENDLGIGILQSVYVSFGFYGNDSYFSIFQLIEDEWKETQSEGDSVLFESFQSAIEEEDNLKLIKKHIKEFAKNDLEFEKSLTS
jgi:hypothetical protein